MTASLATLIAVYNTIRDKCRTDPEWDNDEAHGKWIDAYYAVVESPCLSPADAITKCQFVAKAMDGEDMGFFEEEKVIRQIAALADTTDHPDAKLIELGRQFEGAKAVALSLEQQGKPARKIFIAKHREVIGFMRAIHKARATTLEGFAVKLAAVAFDQTDFEVSDPVPTDVAELQLYRLARDMAKVVKQRGRCNG